jgi:hypothetical protein
MPITQDFTCFYQVCPSDLDRAVAGLRTRFLAFSAQFDHHGHMMSHSPASARVLSRV